MKTKNTAICLGIGSVVAMSCAEPTPPPAEEPTAEVSQEVTSTPPPFTLFESGPVRPLALSPDGKRLFVTNTPDNRLEIFDVKNGGLEYRTSVPVGLEPVAVAARSNDEVWVVNHLSDSVSIVDVSQVERSRVVRTLFVGDEPRDIVFGGPGRNRAFITAAHRGQNVPFDPQLTTPGVGRADVWVFDAGNTGSSLGGTPLTILTLFSDTPRALAVSPDGLKVYAAAFQSGNRTTTINELFIPNGGEANGGLPAPNTSSDGTAQPEAGLIVKFDGTHWLDELGRVWDDKVKFSLPDKDVFVIDAASNPPQQLGGTAGFYSGVGTVLFNMAVNPQNGKVYVANTEALNEKRFEGPGVLAGSSVRGHLHESRITVLDGASVAPRHLNKHIDYDSCCAPLPNAENAKSLASPQGMAVSSNGATLYVAAFGSSKIGVYQTANLENDTFVPSTANQIAVTGGGPSGPVLDEARGRLYVMTRFDNSVSIINTQTKQEVGHVAMHNPEPPSVISGRRFLYDAQLSSSHGDSSCASCHVSGDSDSLAWDLGNPDGTTLANPGPFALNLSSSDPSFRTMKGPMGTQSLRGMANHGPMHWRGDRTGANDAPSAQPDSGLFDEDAAFNKFRPAFVGLLGRDQPITEAEMQAFTDFVLQITYPPNPIRALDNSLDADQQAGRDHFFTEGTQAVFSCEFCHTIDPAGNADLGVEAAGFFGTNGELAAALTFDPAIPQTIKVPHLRNLYQKVGMFGMPEDAFFQSDGAFMGDQVRGFGMLHDASVDTVSRFISALGFAQPASPAGFLPGAAGEQKRRQVESYLLAFESNMAPIVGQQVTLATNTWAVAGPRIDLLIARAALGECDLIAKAQVAGEERGFLYDGAGAFLRNRAGLPPIPDLTLRLLATGPKQQLTYTCVPPGSGTRIGIDNDGDGVLDGDEEDQGTDPRDPASN